MIETYNEYHLGDNLIHVNWLRKFKGQIIHYCQPEYIPQLLDLTQDRDIHLKPLSEKSPYAVNSWINADGLWSLEPYRRNWVYFYLQHFAKLSRKLNLSNLIQTRNDLLFNYPALTFQNPLCNPFDYLIINSRPGSGQFPAYDPDQFIELTKYLASNHRVITTEPTGYAPSTTEANLSVSQIGSLSRFCHTILSVDTGPMWPTFNPYGNLRLRIIYCNLQYFPLQDNCITINNIPDTYQLLTSHSNF